MIYLALLDDIEGVLLGRKSAGLEAVLDHVQDLIDSARPHVGRHNLPPLHSALRSIRQRFKARLPCVWDDLHIAKGSMPGFIKAVHRAWTAWRFLSPLQLSQRQPPEG